MPGVKWLFWLLFSCPLVSIAQIKLTYPVSRLVVQRGADGNGRLYISGQLRTSADRIEAQLTPVSAGQGVATAWQVIQTNPLPGLFAGSITAAGGWYVLTVRAIRNNATSSQTAMRPVGIGEVFITAGQSNSRGLGLGDNDLGAATDRVNAIDSINFYSPPGHQIISSGDPMPFPMYSPLTAGRRIFPMAESTWGWGELGDYIVNRFNVPVAFYTVGWDASTSENWLNSANGIPVCNRYNCVENWQNLQPYTNLRNVLQYYGSLAGIRAVLWHQGESEHGDASSGSLPQYVERLTALIQKTRQDFNNRSIPWVIARASFDGQTTNPTTLSKQQEVINTPGLNVFAGPYNDSIINRNAGTTDVHFRNIQRPVVPPRYYLNPNAIPADMGLSRLARNWNNSLTNSFFQNATPLVPEQFIATGDLTTDVTPGDSIDVPVVALGTFNAANSWQVQVLDTLGRYRATLGSNKTNPIRVKWPDTLRAGSFRLRVVSTSPVAAGVPSSVITVSQGADLSMTLYVNRRVINVGDTTALTLVIHNAGPATATNIGLQHRLPPNLAVVSTNGLTLSNGVLTGQLTQLGSGREATVAFVVRPQTAGMYQNTAEITHSDQVDPDSQPASGTGDGQDDAARTDFRTRDSGTSLFASPNPNQKPLPSVLSNQPVVDPAKADLSLSLWVDTRTPRVNDTLTYRLQVMNSGGMQATGISITAYLPSGQQLVPGGDLSAGGSGPTGGVSSLGANASASFVFRTRVTAAGYGVLKAQITQASPADPDSTPGNGTSNGEDDTAQVDIRSR